MRCGLLGEHLGHSYSPQIHAMLADYSYDLFEVAPEALPDFLTGGSFDALNVTIPYKQAVMPFCAELSENARQIGAVNTLVRRPDGSLYGDNTDYDGFRWLLRRNITLKPGEKALILGNGGACKAVAAVLREEGAEVVIISRRSEDNYDNLDRHADAVLIVNSTPVGMYPKNGARLIDLDRFPACRCVLDLIYNPARTRLLLDAEERSIRCEGGLSMLVGQAKRAAEVFTGRTLEDSLCDSILSVLQKQMQNIVLIGMPGCGKSTLGRRLAARLDRPFFDADEELVKRIGYIPAFFAAHGEAAFRREETAVLEELGKQSGLVISTGGGCVTRSENYPLLHQNGRILWIQRRIDDLPTDGRPVSQSRRLSELFAERRPMYEGFADARIENNGSLEAAVTQLLELMK